MKKELFFIVILSISVILFFVISDMSEVDRSLTSFRSKVLSALGFEKTSPTVSQETSQTAGVFEPHLKEGSELPKESSPEVIPVKKEEGLMGEGVVKKEEIILDVTTDTVSSRWTSSSEVESYADMKGIINWQLESAGNIWSSDKIVEDAINNLDAGIYRVSGVSGAFMHDSFDEGWSPIVDFLDYPLGSFDPYSTADLALQANLGRSYIDIPLAEGGSPIFWIWDNPNTIDNLGSLTFDVVPIPEPSTFILAGTGLLFLSRYFRKLVRSH